VIEVKVKNKKNFTPFFYFFVVCLRCCSLNSRAFKTSLEKWVECERKFSFCFLLCVERKVKNQREIFFGNRLHPLIRCVSDSSEFYKLLKDGHEKKREKQERLNIWILFFMSVYVLPSSFRWKMGIVKK
jgi:hypothetical protein